jgi:hypothetical protein
MMMKGAQKTRATRPREEARSLSQPAKRTMGMVSHGPTEESAFALTVEKPKVLTIEAL